MDFEKRKKQKKWYLKDEKHIGNEYGNYQWNIQQRQINWIEINIWKMKKDWKTQKKKKKWIIQTRIVSNCH